jgi:hypothetical protein
VIYLITSPIGGRDSGVLRRHLLLAEKETDLDVKINSDCDKFEAVIVRVSYWSASV